MDITSLTAVELGKKIKAKEISVVEAVKASIAQIEKVEKDVNSFVTLDKEGALKRAEEVQKMIDDPDTMKAYIDLIKLEMKNELGASYDIYVAMMRAAINRMGTGAVKKGDNYYVAVTMQVPKEVADGMRG